jgi:pimeloyl-ACP methyl ester carboxylesterase
MRKVDGMVINEAGNVDGEIIIFIHGGAGGSWCWSQTVELLPEFHSFFPDLPEHGKSMSVKPFSIKDASTRLIDLIQKISSSKSVNLVGLSVGGQIVLEMLSAKPDLIKTAIVSGAQVIESPGYKLGIYSELAMSFVYWVGIAPWKQNDFWIRWNMRGSAGISDSLFPEFKANFQGLTRSSWSHAMNENYKYRIPKGLEEVNSKILLVTGTKEVSDTQPSIRIIEKLLPESMAIVFGQDRNWTMSQQHNWPMNDPELCARLVRQWVTNQTFPGEFSVFKINEDN